MHNDVSEGDSRRNGRGQLSFPGVPRSGFAGLKPANVLIVAGTGPRRHLDRWWVAEVGHLPALTILNWMVVHLVYRDYVEMWLLLMDLMLDFLKENFVRIERRGKEI